MRAERWLHTVPLKLRSLFRRARADQELNDELRDHIELKTAEYVKRGLIPQDARRKALMELGGVEQAKEKCRDVRRVNWIYDLAQDLRFGLRMLRKSPGFTAVAVLTLALGIGANTAIFSVVSAVLVRGLTFRDPGQLAALFQAPEGMPGPMGWAADGPDIFDWQHESHSFSAISASLEYSGDLTGAGAPQLADGERVTANYFDLLGVQASLGRTFAKDEDEPVKDNEIVLSYSLWRSTFGGSVLGRTIYLDQKPFTIIGVMPATYHDPRTWMNPQPQFWIPLDRTQLDSNRGEHMYAAFGRLKPGVSFAQAQQEMSAIGKREAQEYPNTNKGFGVRVSSLDEVSLETYQGGYQSVKPAILLLQFFAAFLLLIACANVANFSLSRLVSRSRELALRGALGAGGSRLARQMLTESVLLAIASGAVGILLASWCKNALIALAPDGYFPATANISLDWRVLGFAVGVAIASGTLFGLFPAIRAARQNLSDELKGAGTGSLNGGVMPGTRRGLIIFEIASAALLLIGGGLMTRSLASLLAVNPGFHPKNFFTATISPSASQYPKPEQVVRFFTTLQQRTAPLPGLDSVAFTSSSGFSNTDSSDVVIEGRPSKQGDPYSQICIITPCFFRATGIPVLAGRDFIDDDGVGTPNAVIVTQAFQRYFWPHQSPLGKHLRCCRMSNWLTVVGVAGDVRQSGLAAAPAPEIYFPLSAEAFETPMNIVVRSAMPSALIARQIEGQVWKIDPRVPVSHVQTGSEIIGNWSGYLRYRTVLLSGFAVLALLLAIMGVFGAMSYTTAQRAHEIGIRMALGAQPRDILAMVISEGGKMALAGVALGILVSLAVMRVLTSQLFGITPTDPITFLSAAAILLCVTLIACYIPARRAMRVDPMVALRHE